MVDKAVNVLLTVAETAEGQAAAVDDGGIPVLVEFVEAGSQRQKEIAAAALLLICNDSAANRTMVTREGAIPPLVALSQSGTVRAKQKVKRGINLVYGGGSVGLMGLVSRTVYDGGCHVFGVIPKALMPVEISGETVGEVKIVGNMHERKAEMAQSSDAFIALPGGYGTMEELLEIITWSQLGIHIKPIGLLNVDGYYNPLLALFDNGVEEGFIKPAARHIMVSAPTAKELLIEMEQYTPLHEQVAPTISWEIAHLSNSTPTNPP